MISELVHADDDALTKQIKRRRKQAPGKGTPFV